MEYKVKLADAEELFNQCNLFEDTVVVEYPNIPKYWFVSTQELIRPIVRFIEDNITRNGGYMIDQWCYVHAEEQKPRSILNRVHLVLEKANDEEGK